MAELTRSSIKALTARGLTLSEIAGALGMPIDLIYAALAEDRPATHSLTRRGEKLSKINMLRRQGLSVRQIAMRLGMTTSQVQREISFARDPRQNPRPPKEVDIEAFRAFAEDTSYTTQDIMALFEVSESWVSKKRAELKIRDLIDEGLSDAEIVETLKISPNTVARVSVKFREPIVKERFDPSEVAEAAARLSGVAKGVLDDPKIPTYYELSDDLGARIHDTDYYDGMLLFYKRLGALQEKAEAAKKAAEKAAAYRAKRLAEIEVPDLDMDEVRRLRIDEQYYPEGIAHRLNVSLDELKLFLRSQGYASIRDLDKEALPSFDDVVSAVHKYKTQAAVADKLGITVANVRNILLKGGVTSVRQLKARSTPEFDIRRIAMLRTQGRTTAEVLQDLKTTNAKLTEFLKSKGLSIRGVGYRGFDGAGGRKIHPSEVIAIHERFGLDMEGASRELKVDPYSLRAMYTWLDLPVGEIKPRRTNPSLTGGSLLHKGGAFGIAGGASVAISKVLDTKYPEMSVAKRSLISGGVPAGVSLGVYAKTKNEAALWGLAGSVVGTALSVYLFKK